MNSLLSFCVLIILAASIFAATEGVSGLQAARVTNAPRHINRFDRDPSREQARVVISEIMVRPILANDENGQWIELYNASDKAIDLKHWILQDSVGSHVIGQSVLIPSHSYRVVSRADNHLNGLPDDSLSSYVYGSGLTFSLHGDSVTLLDDRGVWVDAVVVPKEEIVEGASVQREILAQGDEGQWCLSTSGAGLRHVEKATPGTVNQRCN